MGRGDLVALVDVAPGRLRTLRGTLRHWTHYGRARAARERLQASGAHGGVEIVLSTGHGELPVSSEHVSRVWFEAPNRWRVEGDDEHHSLDMSDGSQRWQGLTGFMTERGRNPSVVNVDWLGTMLKPGFLLGVVTFAEVAEAELAGRPCIRAVAQRRDVGRGGGMAPLEMLALGMSALERHFWFDAEYGFLVRSEGLVDGEPSTIMELSDVVVDEPLAPGLFQVLEGTTVQTELEERVSHLERMGVDTTSVDTTDRGAVDAAMHRALGSGLGPRGGSSLDDRVRQHLPWGPPPDDEPAAKAAVTAAFAGLGDVSDDGRDLPNVQSGDALAPLLAQARRRLPGATAENMTTVVDAVRFLGPDEAAVWFSIEVDGQRSPLVTERQGRAVRIDGHWLVEHATIAELLALGGVRVPPPDERRP